MSLSPCVRTFLCSSVLASVHPCVISITVLFLTIIPVRPCSDVSLRFSKTFFFLQNRIISLQNILTVQLTSSKPGNNFQIYPYPAFSPSTPWRSTSSSVSLTNTRHPLTLDFYACFDVSSWLSSLPPLTENRMSLNFRAQKLFVQVASYSEEYYHFMKKCNNFSLS